MSTATDPVFDAALTMPEDRRADLAYQLLLSLPQPSGSAISADDFESELDRRVNAYDAGDSVASDWKDVSARIQSALNSRGR